MIYNIFIGALMMLVTAVIHAGGMLLVLQHLKKPGGRLKKWLNQWVAFRIGETVVILFIISLLEVFMWALVYLMHGAIEGIEKAMYFSMVTFTTLGYGEITLGEQWRLLSSIEAANGIIIFGWTTAIIIAIVQDLYFDNKFTRTEKAQE